MSDFNNKKSKQYNFAGYVKPIKIYAEIQHLNSIKYDKHGNVIILQTDKKNEAI